MGFVVETVPTLEAAEERLTALVGAVQEEALRRVNVLTGSNLQRLYFRRVLARALGATANVRFFTPVDLAVAIRRVGPTAPRTALPDGAEVLLLDEILHDLQRAGQLKRLPPDVQGAAGAVAASLTDLREAGIAARDYAGAVRRGDDWKLHDLGLAYRAFDDRIAAFSDRTSLYEDALDPRLPDTAVGEALGGAPLLVVGIYDAPVVQVQLLARCARVTDVRVLLVAPPHPDFHFARRFSEALVAAGATAVVSDEAEGEFDQALTCDVFSAPSRQAEAEEIARRVLALAREDGAPFNRMAILHRLGPEADDLFQAALQRAEVPVFRAGGTPLRHTALGRALLVLLDLMLQRAQRHRLLEFVASPALASTIPPGVRPKPVLWERHSKRAGMVEGWDRFGSQLQEYDERLREEDGDEFALRTAGELREVVAALHVAAGKLDNLTTWREHCDWLLTLLDDYFAADDGDPLTAARSRIEALARLDAMGIAVDRQRFHAAATRAIQRTVLNDREPLTAGVFVGNVNAARSLRFTAIFLTECGERIFPALVRPDPMLLDSERERFNGRLRRRALALKRDRQQEERLLFALVEQAARRFLTLSWARRTNTSGAPKLPSPLLLRFAQGESDDPATLAALYARGAIRKLPVRLAGAAPSPAEVAAGDWSPTATALDASDFRLATLEAAGASAARRLLPHLWEGYRRYEAARVGRNSDRFSVWDGVLAPGTVADPLAQPVGPTTLETYATCPYRYYLRHILKVGAVAEPGEALEMTPLDRGSLVHRILQRWVETALREDSEWAAFLEDETHLMQIAAEEFERAQRGGLAGLPATWAIVQAEVLADLRELLREERERAAQGYRPLGAELEFDDLSIETPEGGTLRFRGRIDRVDAGPDGYVAIDYKTGRAHKSAGDYRSGAALQLPVYIQAVGREYGCDPASVEAAYWYATRRGNFTRSVVQGAEVLGDARWWKALDVIGSGIREGRFFPYPGEVEGGRRRPNCRTCDYFSVCATDVDARFEHKKRLDQTVVRDFLRMQAQRS